MIKKKPATKTKTTARKPSRKVSTKKRTESRVVSATCKKCGQTFKLDIGTKSKQEIVEILSKRDSFECPGHHFELSSPLNYWVIDWDSVKSQNVPTDAEWKADMRKKYKLISSDELQRDYTVTGFSSGVCVAIRKKDGEKVYLEFTNSPSGKRYYY
jgi:hypothetical protein